MFLVSKISASNEQPDSQIAEKAGSELARYSADETLQDKTGTVTKYHRPASQQADSPPTARQRTPYETMQPTCRLRILIDHLQWSNFGLDWGDMKGRCRASMASLMRSRPSICSRSYQAFQTGPRRPGLETGRLAGLSAYSAHPHATTINNRPSNDARPRSLEQPHRPCWCRPGGLGEQSRLRSFRADLHTHNASDQPNGLTNRTDCLGGRVPGCLPDETSFRIDGISPSSSSYQWRISSPACQAPP